MLHKPKTKKEAYKYRYGTWAGNPSGDRYDPNRCAAEVVDDWCHFQCSRKNGHGPDGLYCKQHAKMVEKQND